MLQIPGILAFFLHTIHTLPFARLGEASHTAACDLLYSQKQAPNYSRRHILLVRGKPAVRPEHPGPPEVSSAATKCNPSSRYGPCPQIGSTSWHFHPRCKKQIQSLTDIDLLPSHHRRVHRPSTPQSFSHSCMPTCQNPSRLYIFLSQTTA